MLVFTFDVMVNNSIAAQVLPPRMPSSEEDDIVSMPFLKLDSCKCNCTSFPELSDVLLEEGKRNACDVSNEAEAMEAANMAEDASATAILSANNISASEANSTDCYPESEVSYSETFTLKGSSFHKDFQRVLRSCKQMLLENIPVELKLCNEPVNVNDENAIVAKAKVNGNFSSIGYVPGKKLKKIESAVNNNEITNIALTTVQYTFIWGAGEHKYIPQITITKNGKWLQDDKRYKYNKLFDKIMLQV
jgi:hypothetical protein